MDLLDEEVRVVIFYLPQGQDLLPLHGSGDGHLSPLPVDLTVKKSLVEGQKAPLRDIGLNGSSLTVQVGLVDLQEGPFLFVYRLDNNAS